MTPCEKVTLRPGDYVSTNGMSEADYHAVAEAFMKAGASKGEYPDIILKNEYSEFGWCDRHGALWHQGGPRNINGYFEGRQLTIAQVLGTTAATAPTTAFDTLIEAARKRNEARESLQEAEREFQSALDAANAELGEGFEIRERTEPEEDMTDPENWRVGDVLECVKPAVGLTMGGMYTLEIDPNDGELSFRDDAGDWRVTPSPSGSVKFHHRPA